MTGVPVKRGNSNTDPHTGWTPREDESRYWGDASTSLGIPEMARRPPDVGRVAGNRPSLPGSEGTKAPTPDHSLEVSRDHESPWFTPHRLWWFVLAAVGN